MVGHPLILLFNMSNKKRRRNAYMQLPQRNHNFFDAQKRNTDTYYFILTRMCNVWLDRIVYDNLPPSIDTSTINLGFLENGTVCYFKDTIGGYELCMRGSLTGKEDFYGYMNKYKISAPNGYNRTLNVSRFDKERDGVVIYDNYYHSVPLYGIYYYADKMYDVLRAADVNIEVQKKPNMIVTSENMLLSVQNILNKADQNQSRLVVDKNIDMENLKNVDLSVPYIADKLWTYTTNIWNDFLTWCGIENATNQKKERLVSDEVNANYGNVEMERNVGLNSKIEGFNQVNELFGTNIIPRFNSDMLTKLNNPFDFDNVRQNIDEEI